MVRKAMEASSSSMAPAEDVASDLEKKQTSCDDERPTWCSDNEYSYGHDEDINIESAFEKETYSSDGESLLPHEEIRQPEEQQSANGKEDEGVVVVSEAETGNYKEFEQFDVVQGHSGHYFANNRCSLTEISKQKITKLLSKLDIIKRSEKNDRKQAGAATPGWVRRIQQEWKSLEKDLPEGIYVRVYEERLDLLGAAIVGPAGTPYHDGLFFFDVCFPSKYPDVPPLVYHHSHGLELNPYLDKSGKVCLSLLGMVHGRGCEKWNPTQSTLLQVLVSIQAFVFNPKPMFNITFLSPRFSFFQRMSLTYNEFVFNLSCKTMLYTLRQPPEHFESLVATHFRGRGRAILLACKAYMEGATVGCEVLSVGQGKIRLSGFTYYLMRDFKRLLKEFKAKGADCEGLVA